MSDGPSVANLSASNMAATLVHTLHSLPAPSSKISPVVEYGTEYTVFCATVSVYRRASRENVLSKYRYSVTMNVARTPYGVFHRDLY
jgi:hypothetical protein